MFQLLHLWPCVLRLAQQLVHEEHLIPVSILIEEMLLYEKLPKETSDGPNVDLLIIVPVSEDELWGPIGKGDHVLSEVFIVSPEESAQAKVGYLETPLICDEKIGSLEVPVNDVVLMKEVDSLEHLVQEALNLGDRQGVLSPDLPQIKVDILHYYKAGWDSFLAIGSSRGENLMNSNHILMTNGVEQFDLSYGGVGKPL